jgi:protein SCO1/2
MHLRRIGAAVFVLALALTACSSGSGGAGSNSAADRLHGTKLAPPLAMPPLTLTDQNGQPYDLIAQTKGKVTLMFFGYTHCPDECPTMMADLAETMRNLPAQVRSHIVVVNITPDPARDTPAVLKKWLGQFDPSFVGLTGNIDTIYAYADKVGVPLKRPPANAKGAYEVVHGTQLLAFGLDQKAGVVYTLGTTVQVYEHDFPLLAEGR